MDKMCSGMNQNRFQKIHESAIKFVKKHSMDDLSRSVSDMIDSEVKKNGTD